MEEVILIDDEDTNKFPIELSKKEQLLSQWKNLKVPDFICDNPVS
jgi:hypothetical protein